MRGNFLCIRIFQYYCSLSPWENAIHEAYFDGFLGLAQWVELELHVYEEHTYTKDLFISD